MGGKTLPEDKEIIIKSKQRVQKHGEVFTPKRIVKMMLDQPGIKEACENLEATFLEPSAGEGAFLMPILERKLSMVKEKYNNSLKQYENHALFALTTLYGVELLEDNAQRCAMNLYKIFNDFYRAVAKEHQEKDKDKVYRAAQFIISTNIVQGNFLTKEQAHGGPIIFSEWKLFKRNQNQTQLNVQRTEYTLQEIADETNHEPGYIYGSQPRQENVQLSLFDMFEDEDDTANKVYRYVMCQIADVHLEEMEEVDESHRD